MKSIEASCSLDTLKKLNKKNLAKVAVHYRISPAARGKKSHILVFIEDYCVENDIIDEVEEKPSAETAEVVRLKLEFERKELRLEPEERRVKRQEAQRAQEAAEADCDAKKALQDAQFAEAERAHEEAQELRLVELREARELCVLWLI